MKWWTVLKFYLFNESELVLLFSSSGKDGFMTVVLYCKNCFTCISCRISYLGAIKCRKTQGKNYTGNIPCSRYKCKGSHDILINAHMSGVAAVAKGA